MKFITAIVFVALSTFAAAECGANLQTTAPAATMVSATMSTPSVLATTTTTPAPVSLTKLQRRDESTSPGGTSLLS
ncbi:hypothetical protein N7478_013351 [Penicillium angulare]|uniref:uncharacterized protein n=1 Tax=Penicillium angulare TaxID=116970 RepID=UPI0025408DFE|nr:uncharacterized protein N7478_013351 [Penicillium angulare]KAJ5257247.1 hypothetical protein N7478_013351 [Penicillium angulare]